MTQFKTVWFWDSGRVLENGRKHVMSFYNDSHPKPSLVSNTKSPDHSACHSFNYINSHGHMVVAMVSDDFTNAIPAWYVFMDGSSFTPPLMAAVAFCDGSFENGTVLDYETAKSLGVSLDGSAGFIRYISTDSRMQQIFVSEQFRRRRLSTRLISVADLLVVSSPTWNGIFLNGGDITTDDGEILRGAWSGSSRVTPRVGSLETLSPRSGLN